MGDAPSPEAPSMKEEGRAHSAPTDSVEHAAAAQDLPEVGASSSAPKEDNSTTLPPEGKTSADSDLKGGEKQKSTDNAVTAAEAQVETSSTSPEEGGKEEPRPAITAEAALDAKADESATEESKDVKPADESTRKEGEGAASGEEAGIPQESATEEDPVPSKKEEKPAAKEVVNDSEEPLPSAEEAEKAPEKPKVEIFTLPIGGGPKKNIVLPPIKPMAPKPKPAELAAASTSHTRKDSTDSKVSSRQHQVGKKGSGIPVINSIRRKPAPSSSNASQGTTKSERASLRRQRATNDGEGLKRNVSMGQDRGKAASAQGSAKPRRTLSASNLNDRRKTDGKALAARPSTSEGQTRRAQRKARAAEDAKAGIDGERAGGSPQHKRNISTSSSKRRNTTSSIVMVEGQMFELNEGEEKAEGDEAEALAKKEPAYDEISEMSGLDGDADDDEEVEDEPMIYTDDELNDVPPPGAYAIHPPSTARLEKASELTLYDELGTVVSFGSIFAARRTLICFLRHWLCPFCQMFSQSLQAIDPLPLERANLDLVVIGQGHWHVTKSYKEVMKIPKFIKMYADPSRKIYKMLGMTLRTNDQGPACSRPDYQTMGVFKASMVAIKKGVIDMPLRPPGDLKLLGGEFILGPGPQCSFTHRMVTTRGHLDLPRILVQAGCDLSLKSAPAVLDEENSLRRPGSTKSTDRRSTRRLAKKLAKRRKGSAEFGKRDAEWNRRNQYNTLRALNGELESQQARTLPRSFSKRKPPPLPDVRHLNIGYPMKPLPSGFGSDEENDGQKVAVAQPARRRFVSASVSDTEETDDDEGPSSPTLNSTKPLFIVKDRLTNGMVNGFSRSSSMTSLNRSFVRPPRSTDRPPLPQTSSAAAYAAATARAKLLSARQESEMEVLSGSTSRIQARPYDGALIAGSMPSLSRHSHGSNGSLRTLPGALGSYQGREHAGTSATADSAQTMVSSPSESGMSFSSIGMDNSVSGHSLFSTQGDSRGNDSTLTHSDLQATGATNPLTRSGSIKRNSKPAAVGVPKSVLERMASTGSPRRTAFSTSSPSLPLGDATFSDVMGGVKTPTTPSMDHGKDDFGEDTDYKRLDRKALETPPAGVYTSPLLGAARNGRDFPSNVSEKDVNEVTRSPKPFANLDKPLPPLFASMNNDAQQPSNGTTKTTDLEDGDLLKTPLARKISLDAGDFGSERASQSTDRSSGPLQEIASSSPPSKNRASIIAAVPTPVTPPSQATALPAFNSNPLLAALFPESPAPVPQVAAPAPKPVLSAAPAATPARVPASAQNPLFAAILAEEEARKARPSNGNRVERPSTSTSTQELRQPLAKLQAVERPKTSPISPIKRKAIGTTFGGGSFLDDLDVHDSLRDNSNRNSTTSTQNGGTDHAESDENGEETEEEEDDDDWAPLRASSNMIPAGMPHDDSEQSEGESQRGDASDQSPGEEEGDDDDDDDDEEAAVQRIVRATPASQYALKQVTGRPLSQPTATRPRTVKLKTAGANRVSKPQGLALLSFNEEDEETAGQA